MSCRGSFLLFQGCSEDQRENPGALPINKHPVRSQLAPSIDLSLILIQFLWVPSSPCPQSLAISRILLPTHLPLRLSGSPQPGWTVAPGASAGGERAAPAGANFPLKRPPSAPAQSGTGRRCAGERGPPGNAAAAASAGHSDLANCAPCMHYSFKNIN